MKTSRGILLIVGATTVLAFIASIAAVSFAAQANRETPTRDAQAIKPPTVLFMCPHGAAKSVLASAYFERLAKERGLNVRVESAGTEPDAQVSPAVAKHLAQSGYPVPTSKPRQVAAADLETADVVISIGCDLKDLPKPRGRLVQWDEVPALSDDFGRADTAIRKRVDDLVEEMLRKQ